MAAEAVSVDEYVGIFAALSEPVRIRMLQLIATCPDDDLPCTSLDKQLSIAKSTISYHIQVLRRARLIDMRKAGRNYFYRLRRETFDTFVPGFLEQLEAVDVDLVA